MTVAMESPRSAVHQILIDARLDTIDRMLLGRVSRRDRLEIVREVESQIYELLAGRDLDALGRDDVLAVLARLDPPEAYLPEEPGDGAAPLPPASRPRPAGATREPDVRAGKWAGILGIVVIALVILSPLVLLAAGMTADETLALIVLGAYSLPLLIGSILSITFAVHSKCRSIWSLTGLVGGSVGITSLLLVGSLVGLWLIQG